MTRTTTAILVGLLVVVAAVGSAGVVLAFQNDAPTASTDLQNAGRTVTVSANGQAQAQPDTAILRVAVEASNPKATVARSQVAENVSNVREALTAMGLEDSQITTSDYRIYYDENRQPKPTGESEPPVYRVRHVLSVEVHDTDLVGPVIDAVVDAGATNIYNVQFTISKETRARLQNEALSDAIQSAHSQAETLADGADLTLVDTHSVQTGTTGAPRIEYATTAAAGGSADTHVEAGPVTVTTAVTVTYNASA
ncbi:MAG: SIMPL domain-containing protein [Halanaeroarchaeum sp.]